MATILPFEREVRRAPFPLRNPGLGEMLARVTAVRVFGERGRHVMEVNYSHPLPSGRGTQFTGAKIRLESPRPGERPGIRVGALTPLRSSVHVPLEPHHEEQIRDAFRRALKSPSFRQGLLAKTRRPPLRRVA